jgi:hypothetical protein
VNSVRTAYSSALFPFEIFFLLLKILDNPTNNLQK